MDFLRHRHLFLDLRARRTRSLRLERVNLFHLTFRCTSLQVPVRTEITIVNYIVLRQTDVRLLAPVTFLLISRNLLDSNIAIESRLKNSLTPTD